MDIMTLLFVGFIGLCFIGFCVREYGLGMIAINLMIGGGILLLLLVLPTNIVLWIFGIYFVIVIVGSYLSGGFDGNLDIDED